MKKVAYIYQTNNKWSYAAKTVANGFKNAFIDRGDTFRFFDISKLENSFWPAEKLKLLAFSPDIIFTSVDNIPYLPLNRLKSTALVLWGSFYSPCDYEPQIDTILKKTKQTLNKYSSKHNILIWSQHDELINERFFSGYQKELGLKFIQVLHCADKTKYTKPLIAPEFDFLWVGNVGHRITTYKSFIEPLKREFSNYLEYTEHNMINPETIETKQLYSRSFITPNVHTEAQIKNKILLNERVFTSTMLGGFQICDNLLARKYFNEHELVIATKSSDFIEKTNHYISHPNERIEMIEKMQLSILKNHTYFNRIDDILAAL
ncbi:glycosyltransferase [Pedobacter foliorum]|uniref:glycosyltransferase family protein n=1 Tax=Pedobacter foliorum TaxID=2739058 RepID=UPI0015662218|nr:glycosyltransferase [Pedobacter foliorum]NRF38634.1 glycosyltransferase family 1 protein [Pedobacter foliorum]